MCRRALALAAAVLVAVVVVPPAGAAVRTVSYTVVTAGSVASDVGQVRLVVGATLNDPRGWSLGGSIGWQEVASGGQLRVVLASPSAVAAASPACSAAYSCRVGSSVYLNDRNVRTATPSWTAGVEEYQRYVVLHEVGHWLGLGHTSCAAGGRSAAVMQQQSISLQGCLANVWPLAREREEVARLQGVPLLRTAVEAKHLALGRDASVVGAPVSWEQPLLGGAYQVFQRGSVYASAAGAFEVHGAVRETWSRLGAEWGVLGYPVADERPVAGGQAGEFQRGTVAWSAPTGAHAVWGAVRAAWLDLGGPGGVLGLPTTSETVTPDGVGRYNHFTGGSVYWTPRTGAHEVYGAIRGAWYAQGVEQGPLGYPVSGEQDVPGGRRSLFEGGAVTWEAASGRTTVVLTERP